MEIIYIFLLLSIINVIFSTIRSIVLVGDNAVLASLLSGGYYAFYNLVLIYSVADFALWVKCVITFTCNVIGVLTVKLMEKKIRKDRLWKIDLTVNNKYKELVIKSLETEEIPFSYNDYGKHTMFSVFCDTQAQSIVVAQLVKAYNGKYFISENKGILQ